MRSIIDIPEPMTDAVRLLAEQLGVSRAELVRRALTSFLAQSQQAGVAHAAFGIWAKNAQQVDGLSYQAKLRAEWD